MRRPRARRASREERRAAGLPVQPVRRDERGVAQQLAQRGLEREARRRARALHREPGRLVHRDEAVAVEQHACGVERNRLGLPLEGVDHHPRIAGKHARRCVRSERPSVHVDAAVPEGALRRGRRAVEPRGHLLEQSLERERLREGEATHHERWVEALSSTIPVPLPGPRLPNHHTRMTGSRRTLWLLWALFLGLLALSLALPGMLPSRPHPWHPAQAAVAGFVMALLSLAAGVGTFSLRESWTLREIRAGGLDPRTPAGFARVRRMLLALWSLCLVIGLLGSMLAYGAALPSAAWPYVLAAAALLVLHSPRDWLFTIP